MAINPSTGTCPLTTGASYGTKYEQLASLIPNSQIIPICSSSFSSKILELSNRLSVLGVGDFTLPAGTGGRVTGVEILRGGSVIPATIGADYTITGDLLIFAAGFIQNTDIVRVYLQ